MVRKAAALLLAATGVSSVADVSEPMAATRIQKQFGKWMVACVEPDDKKATCTLSQTFQGVNQKTKKRVFVFSWIISTDKDGVENAILRTPLGVDLERKMKISFPDSDPVSIDFDVCNRRGCFGEYVFETAWSGALKRNETVTIDYNFKNGREVQLGMELEGFRDAYSFYKEQLSK